MHVELFILVISTLISIVVGLFVFAKNPRSAVSQAYSALTTFIVLYSVFNYFSLQTADRLLLIRMVVMFALLAVYFQYLLICILVDSFNKKRQLILFSGAFILSLLSLTPLVFSGLSDDVSPVPVPNILAPVFIIFFICLVALTFLKLVKSLQKSSPQKRSQLQMLIVGMIPIFAISPITGFVMPILFKNPNLIFLSPVYGAFFVCMVGYAIIKHKLFDIRLVVARALIYLLSIATIGLLYGAVVFGLGALFIDMSNISYLQASFFIIFALVVATTYAPIIRFFNKYTNKLFYQDAYDTQEVLDQVGKIIVGSIDLHKIQESSLKVLSRTFRSTYCGFILKEGSEIRVKDFIGETPSFNEVLLTKIIEKSKKQEVLYDEIEHTATQLAQTMRAENISLIMPLITKNEIIGYFVAGPKKSGSIYNDQDKKLLKIIANELAVALQNAQRFEEIQAFNITLQHKVEEATRELKQTNKKLIALDDAKDEFISMASHQLRTPLTSIKGYISMMLEGDLGKTSPQQKQALKEAFTSSQRMVFLISDFLNVSRIKTGRFVIEPKEIDLSLMVSEELIQLKEMAEAKSITLQYDAPHNFPKVMLDDNKTRQVMMNMIDNAIYYTLSGGTVTVQLYTVNKDIFFKVVDTGIGVPKAEQRKLFSKFFRAGNARKARPDGTGLGLFMAQKIVVAQGGAVIFESVEGRGSTFGFRFPLARIKAS